MTATLQRGLAGSRTARPAALHSPSRPRSRASGSCACWRDRPTSTRRRRRRPAGPRRGGPVNRLAADQGGVFAQCNLALMYYNDPGVPQDHAEVVPARCRPGGRRSADQNRGDVCEGHATLLARASHKTTLYLGSSKSSPDHTVASRLGHPPSSPRSACRLLGPDCEPHRRRLLQRQCDRQARDRRLADQAALCRPDRRRSTARPRAYRTPRTCWRRLSPSCPALNHV